MLWWQTTEVPLISSVWELLSVRIPFGEGRASNQAWTEWRCLWLLKHPQQSFPCCAFYTNHGKVEVNIVITLTPFHYFWVFPYLQHLHIKCEIFWGWALLFYNFQPNIHDMFFDFFILINVPFMPLPLDNLCLPPLLGTDICRLLSLHSFPVWHAC